MFILVFIIMEGRYNNGLLGFGSRVFMTGIRCYNSWFRGSIQKPTLISYTFLLPHQASIAKTVDNSKTRQLFLLCFFLSSLKSCVRRACKNQGKYQYLNIICIYLHSSISVVRILCLKLKEKWLVNLAVVTRSFTHSFLCMVCHVCSSHIFLLPLQALMFSGFKRWIVFVVSECVFNSLLAFCWHVSNL